MKKLIFTLILPLLFLNSCATSSSDTFFIHAVYFRQEDSRFSVSAVCEKLSGKDESFHIISEMGESIDEATKKLMNNNKDCYFATCRYYLIDKDASHGLLSHLSRVLCDSNIYPTKADFICVEGDEVIGAIKDGDSINSIEKITQESNTNTVKFLSRYTSGKKTTLYCIGIKDKDFVITGTKLFDMEEQK